MPWCCLTRAPVEQAHNFTFRQLIPGTPAVVFHPSCLSCQQPRGQLASLVTSASLTSSLSKPRPREDSSSQATPSCSLGASAGRVLGSLALPGPGQLRVIPEDVGCGAILGFPVPDTAVDGPFLGTRAGPLGAQGGWARRAPAVRLAGPPDRHRPAACL